MDYPNISRSANGNCTLSLHFHQTLQFVRNLSKAHHVCLECRSRTLFYTHEITQTMMGVIYASVTHPVGLAEKCNFVWGSRRKRFELNSTRIELSMDYVSGIVCWICISFRTLWICGYQAKLPVDKDAYPYDSEITKPHSTYSVMQSLQITHGIA